MGKDNIGKLFAFMDSMLSLPPILKNKFKEDIKIINEEVEVAMGLSVRESETGKLLVKDREIEIAKTLLIKNIDISTIIEATGLTRSEIEKLRKGLSSR